jgi:hypothetical protein
MPLVAATSESLHRGDPTLPQLRKAFIREAKALKSLDGERASIDVAIRKAWKRQAERFWIARNIIGISVAEFAKSVVVVRARGFDLVRYHEHIDEIEAQCENDRAAAIKNGDTYHWPGWRASLDRYLGRKGRKDDVGKPDAKSLAQNVSVDVLRKGIEERDNQILEWRTRAETAEGRLRKQFKGYMAAPGDDNIGCPRYIFDFLDNIHGIDFDIFASPENTQVAGRFYSKEQDAFKQEWTTFRCGFLNPPYRVKTIYGAMQKSHHELSVGHCEKIVALLPGWHRDDWFQEFATLGQVFFLKGHIRFVGMPGNAPWPVVAVVLTATSLRRGSRFHAECLEIPKPPRTTKF